jgi:hypothetical protein
MQRPPQNIPQVPPAKRRQVPVPQRAPQQPARGPQIQRPGPQQLPTSSGNVPITTQQTAPPGYAMPKGVTDVRSSPLPPRITARDIKGNRTILRNAILMSEILGKPLALRDESDRSF